MINNRFNLVCVTHTKIPICAWERNKKTGSTTHHIFLSVKWGVFEATTAPYSASIV